MKTIYDLLCKVEELATSINPLTNPKTFLRDMVTYKILENVIQYDIHNFRETKSTYEVIINDKKKVAIYLDYGEYSVFVDELLICTLKQSWIFKSKEEKKVNRIISLIKESRDLQQEFTIYKTIDNAIIELSKTIKTITELTPILQREEQK